MHAAWAERDARQRVQDAEVKDLMQRLQQGQMFTNLATNRIEELNAELDPIREAKEEAQGNVAKLEALQVRAVEVWSWSMRPRRRRRATWQSWRLEAAVLICRVCTACEEEGKGEVDPYPHM